MSFLGAAFLIALPLAAAPLLLHWFDRRRNLVIQWGAMEFLMEASARKTSARKLKQWLLLLLRCLAIAALVFALARPLLPAGYMGGSDRGETVFVIDNSMSMLRANTSGTLMEAAIARARESLQELPRRERIRVLTTAPYPVWLGAASVQGDRRVRERIASQFDAVTATQGRSDLLAALFAAVQAEADETLAVRRIVLLTDGQTADWRLEDQSGWERLRDVLNASPIRTEVQIVRVDQQNTLPSRGNVAVERLALSRNIVGVNQSVTVTAHINNHGTSSVPESELSWCIDSSTVHEEFLEAIEGGQARDARWTHTFERPGTYRLTCRVGQEDDLLADNEAGIVVEVVDQVPIVIVEAAFELAEMQQDAYFVQAALGWIDGEALDESSIYVPTLVSPEELATIDLSAQRAVVIPNLTRLEEETVEKLSEFVSDGGGLWIGLGPRTDVDSFNHHLFADASGLSPLRLDRMVDEAAADSTLAMGDAESQSETTRLTRIDPSRSEHPASEQLTDDDQLDLTDAVIRRRFQFVIAEDADELSVLLRLNNGQPLAVENFVGRGRVIVQAAPLRLQWSDLARTQAFVVMVRDWVDYLAQPRATRHNLQPGEPIIVRLPTASLSDADAFETTAGDSAEEIPTALLTTPQGDAVELTAEQHDESFVFRSGRTRLPGEYLLQIGLAERAIPFQVQRSSGESNLEVLSRENEARIAAAMTVSRSPEQLAASASTQSDPLWPYLLIGLIILISCELTLSGMLSRERFGSAGVPEFSDVDSSGEITAGQYMTTSPFRPWASDDVEQRTFSAEVR